MTTSGAPSQTAAKARGLLFGVAVGDALGAAFEGAHSVDGERLAQQERAATQLRYTDDTALTLVLARHLVDRQHPVPVDEDALALELAREWQREPWRGYGMGSREIFERVLRGTPWRKASEDCFGGEGSYGNGGAMRVAPIALVGTSPAHVTELAARSAVITHSHLHGQRGAMLQACAAFLALNSDGGKPLDKAAFLSQLSRAVEHTDWRSHLDQVHALVDTASPAFAAERLGNDAAAPTSVPLAVLAFLQHPDQPAEAIRYAIRAGGDTDTIASMAGALAAARTGVQELPTAWLDRLENAEHVGELADTLATRMAPSQ
ncbi:poly(ADP-ribose) glycohydrolase ARH3 [Saccharopolyspora lacisalsi]|uniref:Poly(ADP-ribose) glycohydrolase ARH3 n=1 Tax=Halosaccharopolyspora lacisalsi TaxID=1000566 RepID=A0A839DTJ0_9PSEU|nr:ADP-ribosylglycohydrolase family protein [Halosaccharopolyspora lacisalsi]MBA8824250.1 poly(ADP-ribose) glycohydrolase ARH3 [Halosaccharopolyspora lacisalsi]